MSYYTTRQLIVQKSLVAIAVTSASVQKSPDGDTILHCNQSMENHSESVRADSIDMAQVVGSAMRIDQLGNRHGVAGHKSTNAS